MSLKFSPGNHQYRLDGKPVQGVTTLLSGGIPKPALVYWSAKQVAEYVADNPEHVEQLRAMGRNPMVAALKSVPWESRDTAAVRGTDVHALAEELVHGREVQVPEHLAEYVEGYVRFLDEWKSIPLLTEHSCASREWGYAGRFDFIGSLGGPYGDATVLADWKTSKGVYGETALQTAAYARAEFYVTDDDPDTEHPMPIVERIAVVHITPGETRVHDLGDIDKAFGVFRHVQYVAKQKSYLEGVVSEALTLEESA
jgi:hypothetical protein